MSLTAFIAICILGLDFMIFVLFKWLYGEKNRNWFRRSAPRTAGSQTPLYYVSGRRTSQTGVPRTSLRTRPGRPHIVNRSNTAVSRVDQSIEHNNSGKYTRDIADLARRRA